MMERALLSGGLSERFLKQVTPELHLPKFPSAGVEGVFQAVSMPRDTSSASSNSEQVTAQRLVLSDCNACETNNGKQNGSGRLGIRF